MKLEKFIQKNSLNLYKFYIKGYCTNINNNITNILFFLEDLVHNKSALNFVLNNDTICFANVIKLKKFEIPNVIFENKIVDYTNFYRPVGVLQTQFKLDFATENTPTTVTSEVFNIIENMEKTESKLTILQQDRYIKVKKENFFKNMSKKCWVPDKIIVHDGKMHADDILSVGLVKYINPTIKVTRTRDIPEDFDGIIADVGNGRYDHHNEHIYRVNKNTGLTSTDAFGNIETYAAFGLLAKDILPGLIGDKSYYTIDHQFISALDNSDNYGTFNDVSYLFELFNPAWNSNETSDAAFEEATNIAKIFIGKIIEKEIARTEAIPYVKEALKNMTNNILILDKRAPWQGLAKKSNALITIYPLVTVYAIQNFQENNDDARNKATKITLPKEWLELEDEDLVFCHQELFFAVFKTKEKAIEMATKLVKKELKD